MSTSKQNLLAILLKPTDFNTADFPLQITVLVNFDRRSILSSINSYHLDIYIMPIFDKYVNPYT